MGAFGAGGGAGGGGGGCNGKPTNGFNGGAGGPGGPGGIGAGAGSSGSAGHYCPPNSTSISGTNGSGGGGAGLGGAVFVRSGAGLTIASSATTALSDGSVAAGTGINAGAAAGSGLFLMSGIATTFDIAGTYTLADSIADDSATSLPGGSYTPGNGAGAAITKQGGGTLVLSGANTYAGATDVTNGLLRVTGSIAGSAVAVAASGTLTGDGSTGAIDSFGTLAPGTMTNPQGGLTAKGLTLEAGALSCFHTLGSSNASSHLVINGTANVNGIARIDFAGGPSVGTMYILLQATSVTGKLAGFETNMPNLDGTLTYSGTSVTFTVTASDVLFQDGFEQSVSDSPCVAAFAN
jgi:autotransporter-associated beta strand protein